MSAELGPAAEKVASSPYLWGLVERLTTRRGDYHSTWLDTMSEAAYAIQQVDWERAKLQHEVEMLTTGGIIEVAIRNPSVADYMRHWEGRAEAAEAALWEQSK